jgi:hypothetical protein
MQFRSQLVQLEERCLMANAGVPIPQFSLDRQEPLSKVVWNGGPPVNTKDGKQGIKAPDQSKAMKSITITNFSNQYIYPFLRSPNTGKAGNNYYDPQDYIDQEFREYVGFSVGQGNKKKEYLGLPPHATITIQVPLVLWDGNHVTLTSDGKDLTATAQPVVNVFGYNPSAQITIAQPTAGGSTWVLGTDNFPREFTPLVMFYHAGTSAAVGDDAPAQLVETTFRDPYLKQLGVTDASQTFPLLSYDVSYVNTLHAPVALEASNVPITSGAIASGNLAYYRPNQAWGWNGSNQGAATFDPLVSDFVANRPNTKAFIGDYFGGNGWPRYFNPNPAALVIPSGANLFDNSPLDARQVPEPNGVHTSHYDSNQWLLSSAGGGPIKASGTAAGVSTLRPKTLTLTFGSEAEKAAFGKNIDTMLVAAKKNKQTISVTVSNGSFKATTVGSLDGYKPTQGKNEGMVSVTLDTDLPQNAPMTVTFSRVATDYATTAITNLWYSWANYYTNYYASKFPSYSETATGTLNTSGKKGNAGPFVTNQVTFASLPPNLAVGMTVSGNGVVPGTTVLEIAKNTNNTYTVSLSQIPTNGQAGVPATPQKYTFGLPPALPISANDAHYTTPYTLAFDPAKFPKNQFVPNPLAFAGAVYETMSVGSTAPNTNPYLPTTMDVVNNVIGFNVNFKSGANTGWNTELVAQVRDIVKSILRGVVSYVATPNQDDWYPDPATRVPGTYFVENHVNRQAPFNVFNLDPYVWFVHKVENLSGYGFSVDDDVANPIATGPTDPKNNSNNEPNNLQVGFAGTRGEGSKPLSSQKQWFPTTKFGSFMTLATVGTETIERNGSKVTIPIITLKPTDGSNPLRALNMVTLPGGGQLGAGIVAPGDPGLFQKGTQLVYFPDGVDNKDKPNIELSLPPAKKPPTTPIKVIIYAGKTPEQ